jgi:hypothetical protein
MAKASAKNNYWIIDESDNTIEFGPNTLEDCKRNISDQGNYDVDYMENLIILQEVYRPQVSPAVVSWVKQ